MWVDRLLLAAMLHRTSPGKSVSHFVAGRRCGLIYCQKHVRYRRRLDADAQPDERHGSLHKVCRACYTWRPTDDTRGTYDQGEPRNTQWRGGGARGGGAVERCRQRG